MEKDLVKALSSSTVGHSDITMAIGRDFLGSPSKQAGS